MKKMRFIRFQKKSVGKTIGRLWMLTIIILAVFTGNLIGGDEKPDNPVPEPRGTDNVSISQVALKSNPFDLKNVRIVPGAVLKIKVNKKSFDDNLGKIEEIYLKYSSSPKSKDEHKVPLSSWYFKETDGELCLFAKIPAWEKLEKIKKQSFWRGILTPYKAEIFIDYRKKGNELNVPFLVELPDWKWALFWGIVLSILLILLTSWGLRGEPGSKSSIFSLKKLILSQTGAISVSKTQVLIWTLISLFGIIYVYRISAVFLEITPQVLMFLGIGGGTAVAAKYHAVRKKEKKSSDNGAKSQGAAAHGFFKVQMLSFTVVIAVIVVIEIIKTNVFPILPENLVVVMAISNAVYLGDKVSGNKK